MLPKADDEDKTRALGPHQTPSVSGMAAAVDADALAPGTLAGPYVLKREIASGGGGTVYEAQHKVLGRKAAVKVLRRQLAASPQMVTRFVREAQAVNLIRHPAIVDIFEFDTLPDGRPFYVMELLEGTDVRSLLNERGRFSPAEVLEILDPVCSALQVAHEQGIVHRDLKASNIFVSTNGGKRTVKLLDFGIAKLMHPDASEAGLTVVGTRLGTSYTMAPEQIRGDGVDPRTDIYALGVVLYHLLTGQYPFRAETMTDIERQHLEAPPPRPSQGAPVSPAFDAVVLRCMEKTAERRYQSVKAFLEALREAVGAKTDKPEIVARAAAIFVEIRVAEGADAESDAVLDDTSAILDATEQSLRGAGLGLPLQTGSAIIGARVLADEASAADAARDEVVAVAQGLADELAARPTAVPEVHVNITVHVGPASVKDSAEAPDGKEIVGGEILATADWAPQENVTGLHLTAAAGGQ
ncbi:MAG TPA: serine/threonine-protein kinase [Polyangia bacterium]|nr:serine/threonine-protein kinase [Polyangia bacterium]